MNPALPCSFFPFGPSQNQVNTYRRQLDVRVAGFEPPRPIQTFGQCGFEAALLTALKRAGYNKPTAIQAQALPAALSGRDVLVGGGRGRAVGLRPGPWPGAGAHQGQ